MPEGVINLDKPEGMSSARAVAAVKRLLPRGVKIGHAGTLDPFATGVLLLLIGKATERCERLMDEPKQYEATVKLGATTRTDDPEAPEQPWQGAVTPPTSDTINRLLPQFVGEIQQRPPQFSAIKVAGRRAYDIARKGEAVSLEPRVVRVDAIQLLEFNWPLLRLRINCGRGMYVRSLARDLGEALAVGGYLTQLRRTRVGRFTADNAVTLTRLATDGLGPHLSAV